MTRGPALDRLDHVERMCGEHGIFEHALGTTPRREHGFCTDDNARLLAVLSDEPADEARHRLSVLALDFVIDGIDAAGRVRNRMDADGRWTDRPGTEDCWGRAVWALGVAAARHPDAEIRRRASIGFARCAVHRSKHVRSMAFAAIGAAAVVETAPGDVLAIAMLERLLDVVGGFRADRAWPWPEPRLTYANAVLAEAVIAAGHALGRIDDRDRGLAMLAWLVDIQVRDGHLSVVGTNGRGPDDDEAQFDQQPIEVSTLADACWRAFTVSGDRRWLDGVEHAAAWFHGVNDSGLAMRDAASGGGFDGLHRSAVNLNQGAESTLAHLSTMQRARAAGSLT